VSREAAGSGADVDVVVVNYNAGEHLLRCIDSIFRAAGVLTLEVWIVDNASHDDSARVAVQRFPDVHLIQNKRNRGFGAACNQGIAAGRAPFAFMLNPDAEIAGGTFAGLVKIARDLARTGVIGTLVRDPDGALYPSARKVPTLGEAAGHALIGPFSRDNRFSRAYTMDRWDRTSQREVDWVSGSSMLLRRAAVDEVGRWLGFELSAENKRQAWIPSGFAHGFLSLRNGTELLYKCTDFYSAQAERSLRWNDPQIAIDWPLEGIASAAGCGWSLRAHSPFERGR
jgi:glycosyltransferase involved in cell wall biosynthesis